jgi:hypothetical protein
MKSILIFRKKVAESDHHLFYNEYQFWGFIGFKNGFKNSWFTSFIPFTNGHAAWHFLGFRFTKSPMYVSKVNSEINGWYNPDKVLIQKLRKL